MSPVIVVAELDITEQHGGQAVFLDLDERRTAGGDRQTAHGDVRITARTGRSSDLDARYQAEHFGFGAGVEIVDDLASTVVTETELLIFDLSLTDAVTTIASSSSTAVSSAAGAVWAVWAKVGAAIRLIAAIAAADTRLRKVDLLITLSSKG